MIGRRRPRPDPSPGERAEHLKERIYVTFTSLAVVLALGAHPEDTTAGRAATTLAVTVVATALAVFLADVVSHVVVHEALPAPREAAGMASVSIGALGVLVLPLLFLLLAGTGRWQLDTSLHASAVALVTSLVAVGWIAVRRVRLPLRSKVLVLLGEAGLGVAVVGLELLAHG